MSSFREVAWQSLYQSSPCFTNCEKICGNWTSTCFQTSRMRFLHLDCQTSHLKMIFQCQMKLT